MSILQIWVTWPGRFTVARARARAGRPGRGAPGRAPTIRPHPEQSVAGGVVQKLCGGINNQNSIVCRLGAHNLINGREVGRLANKPVAYLRNNQSDLLQARSKYLRFTTIYDGRKRKGYF